MSTLLALPVCPTRIQTLGLTITIDSPRARRSSCLQSFPSLALPRGWEGFSSQSHEKVLANYIKSSTPSPCLYWFPFRSTKPRKTLRKMQPWKAVRLFCLGAVIWFCLQMVLKQQTHHSRFKISNMPTDSWLDLSLLHRRQFPSGTVNLAESWGGHIALDGKSCLLNRHVGCVFSSRPIFNIFLNFPPPWLPAIYGVFFFIQWPNGLILFRSLKMCSSDVTPQPSTYSGS